MRGEGGFDQFHVHPAKAVLVLHHDRGHLGVGQQSTGLGPAAVHPGGDLGLNPNNPMAGLR